MSNLKCQFHSLSLFKMEQEYFLFYYLCLLAYQQLPPFRLQTLLPPAFKQNKLRCKVNLSSPIISSWLCLPFHGMINTWRFRWKTFVTQAFFFSHKSLKLKESLTSFQISRKQTTQPWSAYLWLYNAIRQESTK